jgi:hypothetical protein
MKWFYIMLLYVLYFYLYLTREKRDSVAMATHTLPVSPNRIHAKTSVCRYTLWYSTYVLCSVHSVRTYYYYYQLFPIAPSSATRNLFVHGGTSSLEREERREKHLFIYALKDPTPLQHHSQLLPDVENLFILH